MNNIYHKNNSGGGSPDLTGDNSFENLLEKASPFKLRRAVERLREGLFDPLGVKLLSSGDNALNNNIKSMTDAVEKGKPSHLCVCGAYGQGKSHTLTYIRHRALEENFVVSYINLDPREVPFHNQKMVYLSLMNGLSFPDEVTGEISVKDDGMAPVNIWRKKVQQWLSLDGNSKRDVEDIIPERIPHRFKAILAAIAKQTEAVPYSKRKLKKHARFKPREFPWILGNAFMGKDMPVVELRNAMRYRQVNFYQDESLVCKDDDLYLEAIQGYAELFQVMGYKGWVLLFDEAESIMLTRIMQRSKSYAFLHKIFCPKIPAPGFLPVFAFTHDFFTFLKDEDFERTRIVRKRKRGARVKEEVESLSVSGKENEKEPSEGSDEDPREVPWFERDYSAAWKDINIYRLRELTSREWHILIKKLILIHASAYKWQPDVDALDKMIFSRLLKQSGAESRMKLKLIVNLLDLKQQHMVLASGDALHFSKVSP
ncbi:conserved hypothetical protein [Desulfamplus magnetovallimortis]|uniref:Uncharacterized protein n=2 Tax=Desulfamplus magnetovallimortis TaxID=1246637 RepID=A0A1W1H8X6_9BACT|nr:conserved hypothetical protein [Desulfamplus magnetovallimortis]